MRASSRTILAIVTVITAGLVPGSHSAKAQEPGLGGIFGGYGAMAGGSGSSMGGGSIIVDPSGMGGNVIVPITGGMGASMAPSMKGAGLSFRSRPAVGMSTSRLSLSMDSMSGISRTGGRRSFMLQPRTFTGGMGLGGGIGRMPSGGGMGVMPPNFGYPFRQPGSLFLPSSPGTGMGM